MNLSRFTNKVSAKRVNLYVAHILLFILPFEPKLVPPVLVLFIITNLTCHSWTERVFYFKKRWKYILMFSSLYILNIFGLLYTDNMPAGLFQLEVQLSLLIIPLTVLTSNVINKFTLPELLKTYVVGVIIAFVLCMIYATVAFIKHGDSSVFYYTHLSYFLHPGYFAMYANMALSIILIYIFHSKDKVKWRYYVALSLLIICVFQLSSRTGLIVLAFLLIFGVLSLILPRIRWKNQFRTYMFAILITAAGLAVSYQFIKSTRVSDVGKELTSSSSSAGSRLAMWKSSYEVFKEHPIAGYGAGDAKDVMQAKFREDRLAYAVVKNLNVHDEYIQVLISYGIIGFIALILPMVYPLKFVFKGSNFIYLLFIGNVGFNFLTESVLETQAGNVFYGVMWSLLYFTWKD